jgi:mannose/cellobiose epimerase-like protein (N-acyl-D-glucosamine 2-epimerase family)
MRPDFRSRQTLLAHVRHTLAFYAPRCVDPSGGFYHFFKDDGTVYDSSRRHLVSSTRFVFNYAMAFRHFGDPADRSRMLHGLRFLRDVHRNGATGGYAWELDWREGEKRVVDDTNHCYGLAFVLLAYSQAMLAGCEEASAWIAETFALMEERFWEPRHGLYADEASGDWSRLSGYRGQNANMHACEALITAFEATANPACLDRAALLARNITVRQAGLAQGLVWEHYSSDWSVDPDYNRHDKTNIFRPWGYQPGHLAEWAKLLLILERHGTGLDSAHDWMLPVARSLFDAAMHHAWDREHGGIHYGFGPDGEICDADKYFWVQAESLAAAALLAARTGDDTYWTWYERIWEYSWDHFVDHRYGAWFRILGPRNEKLTDEKSPAGKVDYHTMGACYEVLRVLQA